MAALLMPRALSPGRVVLRSIGVLLGCGAGAALAGYAHLVAFAFGMRLVYQDAKLTQQMMVLGAIAGALGGLVAAGVVVLALWPTVERRMHWFLGFHLLWVIVGAVSATLGPWGGAWGAAGTGLGSAIVAWAVLFGACRRTVSGYEMSDDSLG